MQMCSFSNVAAEKRVIVFILNNRLCFVVVFEKYPDFEKWRQKRVDDTPLRGINLFRTEKHQMKTIATNKNAKTNVIVDDELRFLFFHQLRFAPEIY